MASASENNSAGKQQKCCDEIEIDRLSNLPEGIVSHILSLLPIESAVATSLLSKSWKPRWTKLLTTLAFDYDGWSSRGGGGGGGGGGAAPGMSFDQFVNKVLLRHSAESIHKFSLKWYESKFHPLYLYIWMNIVLAKNIRVIDIDLAPDRDVGVAELILPPAFYTCGKLEVLKLSGNLLVKLPHVVCLPKITVLQLHSVSYESDESFHKLISGCPRLQSLSIERTGDDSVRVYTICSRTLKRLEVIFLHPDNEDQLKSILKVKIKTPALEFITLYNLVSVEYFILGPTLVNEAELDIKDGVFGLVQSFDRLRFLSIASRSMDYVVLSSRSLSKFSASFARLTKLAVEVEANQWSGLLNLINCCINLEVLEITKDPYLEESWRVPGSVPSCFSSSLRRVSFNGFLGLDDEIGLLKFILEHASLIETVTLSSLTSNPFWSVSLTRGEKLQILNEALQLPRSSPTCKISYSLAGSRCPCIG